jgi:hypothetical protein
MATLIQTAVGVFLSVVLIALSAQAANSCGDTDHVCTLDSDNAFEYFKKGKNAVTRTEKKWC